MSSMAYSPAAAKRWSESDRQGVRPNVGAFIEGTAGGGVLEKDVQTPPVAVVGVEFAEVRSIACPDPTEHRRIVLAPPIPVRERRGLASSVFEPTDSRQVRTKSPRGVQQLDRDPLTR